MESVSKNKIKYITALRQKKYRDEEKAFVVEGVKMVEEVLSHFPDRVLFCVHTTDFSYPWDEQKQEHYLCDERTLKQCSSLQTPNKVLAVVRQFEHQQPISGFTLALDGVQDPGNMGTLLRLADWYGVGQVVCSTHTVDIYNPKVVQASMGSVFRVPVVYADLATYLSSADTTIYGALLEGENVYTQALLPEGILVLGNEGNGISEAIIPLLTKPLTIPRVGEAESLNVSTAGAILLSEFYRSTLKK